MVATRTKISLFVSSILLVIALDQWTKYKVRTDASWQYVDLIPGWLGFHYTLNPGFALGIEATSTPIVSTVSIIAALLILGYVLYTMKDATRGYMIFMGFVIGGAFGNIIDRIFLGPIQGHEGILQGRVVDFIHIYKQIGDTPVFPYIFNVADMAISISLVTLILFHKRLIPEPAKTPENNSVLNQPPMGMEVEDPFAGAETEEGAKES